MAKKRLQKEVKNTYADYKRRFLTVKEQLKQRGEMMYDTHLLSEREWEAMNKSWENTYKREIKAGKREKMPNINEKIVKQQTFQYSEAQAKIYQKEMRKAGYGERTIREIMLGVEDYKLDDFNELLAKEYDALRASGETGKNAKLAISYKYFGSV